MPHTLGPDTRIANLFALPPGPFQLTGSSLPFDVFAADMSHEYFTRAQQADCAIDAEHVSSDNPTRLSPRPAGGSQHDLRDSNRRHSHDTGQTMAFFNMQQGDAPVFQSPRRSGHHK